MKQVEQDRDLPSHQPRVHRVLTQASHATGWDLWIYRCTTHRGVILSASPGPRLHHPQHLRNHQPLALRSRRMIHMSNNNNRRRKQDRQRPRAVRAIIWTPLALCKSAECLTTRFGARVFAATPQSDKHRTGAHKGMMVSTEEEAMEELKLRLTWNLLVRRREVQFWW